MGGLGVNVKLQRVLVLLLVVSEGWLLGNSELVCEDRLLSVCNESCFCNGQSEGAGRVVSGEANATDGEPEPDVALAFGLVTAAGLSTALGASLGRSPICCDPLSVCLRKRIVSLVLKLKC